MKKTYLLPCALLAAVMTQVAFADEAAPTLKWNGDLRYRHEYVQQPSTIPGSFHQERIRARAGFLGTVNDTTSVEFRLASGLGGSRNTANQTLGGSSAGFADYAINLDRAYFNWSPLAGLNMYGGRMKNLYFVPGGSDLVWGADMNFDGLMATYQNTIGGFTPFFATNFYWLDKTVSATNQLPDVTLASGQIGLKDKMTEDLNWTAAVGIHHYNNINGHGAFANPGTASFYNNSNANNAYSVDFNEINAGAELNFAVIGLPFTAAGDWVVNTKVDSEKNGYFGMIRAGAVKKTGDWSLAVDYRKLDKDSVVGAFSDPNSWAGSSNPGTNGKGFRFVGSYMIAKNLTGNLNYYVGKYNIAGGASGDQRNRLQAELSLAF